MHVLAAVLFGLGAILFLIVGLSSVLRDLVERGPHATPLLDGDDRAWRRGGADSVPRHPQARLDWGAEDPRGHSSHS